MSYTTASNGAYSSILNNSNNASIKNSTFRIINKINTRTDRTLKELYQRVAPNAIHNDGGRVDDPKCHPGTREEVIGRIERWMDAAENDRILWLSGPAGAGKTAIMKTITERSANRGVHTINFFFFRGDSTRNSSLPVVPTILYQLFDLYPASCDAVAKILSTRPRILDGSITQQCTLISVLFPIIRTPSPSGPQIIPLISTLFPIIRQLLPVVTPIVLLVDGLDECDIDAERSQGDLLCALERLVMEDESPFRLLVASRATSHIQMTFNELSSQAQTIFLDGQYHPENDIRLFVTAEFDRIKTSHPSKRSLPIDWPSSSDIDAIVTKSSGQFIYAATVMRYLTHASNIPSLSLERVNGVVPAAKNSPFTNLDSVYIFILSGASNPDIVRGVLSVALLQQSISFEQYVPLQELLCHDNPSFNGALVESCVSELSAIVELSLNNHLKFCHASLADFLQDQDRSGTYFIDNDIFRAEVILGIWDKCGSILVPLAGWQYSLQIELFKDLQKTTPEITHRLLNLPFPEWTVEIQTWFFKAIQRLYYKDDIQMYKQILRRYTRMLVSRNMPLRYYEIPYALQYYTYHKAQSWWQRLLD